MKYELAKELKEAGFPQVGESYLVEGLEIAEFPEGMDGAYESWFQDGASEVVNSVRAKEAINIKDSGDYDEEETENINYYLIPTLSELIEACGNRFDRLILDLDEWRAGTGKTYHGCEETKGKTPEEAVAHLWLALNK